MLIVLSLTFDFGFHVMLNNERTNARGKVWRQRFQSRKHGHAEY